MCVYISRNGKAEFVRLEFSEVYWLTLLPHNMKALGLSLPADWDLSV